VNLASSVPANLIPPRSPLVSSALEKLLLDRPREEEEWLVKHNHNIPKSESAESALAAKKQKEEEEPSDKAGEKR
jgi:hypothetical protein